MCLYVFLRWIVNALVLMVIPYIVRGVYINSLYTALVIAVVLGFINSFIRPILIILTLPINILTLGLFTFVINGFLFWFVSTFIKGFTITDFWSAFWAALVYTIVSIIINLVSGQGESSNVSKRKLKTKKAR